MHVHRQPQSFSVRLGRIWRPPYHWFLSKLIELRSNTVLIDGCSFSVDSPAIHPKSRFLFNRYEPTLRRAVKRLLNPEIPVIELGSAIGVVSCIVNKGLKNPSRHVAVEANPELIPVLEENRRRNGCGFSILHRALAYGAAEVPFHVASNFTASRIHGASARIVAVPSVTLERIADDSGFESFTLLCDVEGSEVDLIQNEADVLEARVAMLFIEIHDWLGEGIRNGLVQRLVRHGFVCISHSNDDYVFRNLRYCAHPLSQAA